MIQVAKPPRSSEYCGVWTMDLTPQQMTVRSLIDAASRIYNVPKAQITSSRGTKRAVRARHFVCYHAYETKKYSLGQIARILDRDHTSILYGHFAHAYRHNLYRSRGCAPRHAWLRSLSYEGPEPQ